MDFSNQERPKVKTKTQAILEASRASNIILPQS